MVSYQRDHPIEYYKQRMLKVVNLRPPKTFTMTWSNSYLLPSQPLNIPPYLMKRYVLCYCCLHLECVTIEFFFTEQSYLSAVELTNRFSPCPSHSTHNGLLHPSSFRKIKHGDKTHG